MKINIGESIAAAAVVGFGALMMVFGSGYPIGSLSQMGPGYFPLLVGSITVLLGIATLIQASRSETPAPEIPWRAFALVFCGVLAWAFMAERLGLVPASVALIVLASLARPPVKVVATLLTAAIATAAAVLLFIYGFGLPLQAFGW